MEKKEVVRYLSKIDSDFLRELREDCHRHLHKAMSSQKREAVARLREKAGVNIVRPDKAAEVSRIKAMAGIF